MVLRRIKESAPFLKAKAFVHRYERFFMPAMLIGGTAVDAIQFRLLQVQTTFIFMAVYTVVCGVCMLLMVAQFREEQKAWRYLQLGAPFLQQFTIGALLSTSLLFYWFSGTIEVSWPIIGLVAVFMVSNEVFRHVVTKPAVMAGMLYFALFSLTATLAAYVFNSLDPVAFVAGGVASLFAMGLFLVVFLRVAKAYTAQFRMWLTVCAIFALMNTAYFLNVIPPIPLSLREVGLYNGLTRTNGDYIWEGEEETWWEKVLPGRTVRMVQGDPLYVYTAIFAPADLHTTMVHRWEHYDEEAKAWETADMLSFALTGGRSDGFRGYSVKRQLDDGRWRVTVQTERGQVLGRVKFDIVWIE